ncbi:MAG: NUDIX hydrolase [Pseudomonadota bacterium]|jgi:ADP-ribose pyrophosphatase|nr:MAG: NUDIX hydrolase [Pseudomonadota bacterium]
MPWKPEVTVAAIVEHEGRFLLVEERIRRRVVFNQPAGHVEENETLLEAVVRETREETAWRFVPQALLGVYSWRNPVSGRSTLRFAFVGAVTDHDPRQPLDRGILGPRWLTRTEILEREPQLRSPLVLRCIDDYLSGRRLPLEAVAGVAPAVAAREIGVAS